MDDPSHSKLFLFGIGYVSRNRLPCFKKVMNTRTPKRIIIVAEKGTIIELAATIPWVEYIVTTNANRAIMSTPQNLLRPIYSCSMAPPPVIIIMLPEKMKNVVKKSTDFPNFFPKTYLIISR